MMEVAQMGTAHMLMAGVPIGCFILDDSPLAGLFYRDAEGHGTAKASWSQSLTVIRS